MRRPVPSPRETHTSGAATIEAVGSGTAPVGCPSEQAIGMGGQSPWWFQARAADNRLWTIRVAGLGGSTPLVSKGDVVTLELDWRVTYPVPGITETNGLLQVSDGAGTPLLWAGSTHWASAIPAAPTWISFRAGDDACGTGAFCEQRQSNVIATVNGSSMTLPPYGAGTLGGYSLKVTYFASITCGDYSPPFQAAAAKVSPSTNP